MDDIDNIGNFGNIENVASARRDFMNNVRITAIGIVCAAPGFAAMAQPFPAKPVRFIVGTAAGGGVDTISRIVGQRLTERWSQQVVVENRAGAGGAVGSEFVAKSAPDGYTLLTISIAHAVIPASHRNLNHDPVRDLAPVTVLVNAPNVLVVHPSLPAKSVKELVSLAKSRQAEIQYASSGNGSPAHLAGELFKLLSGANFVHVPYKGTAPAMTDVIGGRVSFTFGSILSSIPHVKTGKLRLLGATGSRRAMSLPDTPTIAEAGVAGYAVDVWYAMLAPSATPRAILSTLNADVARVLHAPELRQRLSDLGLEPVGEGLDASARYIDAEIAKWAKVVKAARIAAE
jgi:tripartite-type tricarboxylate transporter receptor subunit TctC